jgi:hypothetical protein
MPLLPLLAFMASSRVNFNFFHIFFFCILGILMLYSLNKTYVIKNESIYLGPKFWNTPPIVIHVSLWSFLNLF